MTSLTRFSVKPLSSITRTLADVASGRRDPDLVVGDTRRLSICSERLIRLSIIPEIRITDKGLVLVPAMEIVPLFEPA